MLKNEFVLTWQMNEGTLLETQYKLAKKDKIPFRVEDAMWKYMLKTNVAHCGSLEKNILRWIR